MQIVLTIDGVPLFDSGNRDYAPSAVKALAIAWASLDDDAQAKFFEEVALIMRGWTSPSLGWDWQAYQIGRHLATCECISDAGRELIIAIAESMKLK